MQAHPFRPFIVLGALIMLGAALVAIAVANASSASASDTYVIDITDTAFNPPVCKVNRGDTVRWRNVGTVPHQVQFNAAGNETAWSTEMIQPGATSIASFEVQGGFDGTYHLEDDPSVTGLLQGPPTSNTWTVSCTPNPPTPTPSPTPSVTATPTASPTPTPNPVPPRCVGQYGCAVAPELARDGGW